MRAPQLGHTPPRFTTKSVSHSGHSIRVLKGIAKSTLDGRGEGRKRAARGRPVLVNRRPGLRRRLTPREPFNPFLVWACVDPFERGMAFSRGGLVVAGLAGSDTELAPKGAAEMRLAGEAQRKRYLEDAQMAAQRITQIRERPLESLLLDVARHSAMPLEHLIELRARDMESRTQSIRRQIAGPGVFSHEARDAIHDHSLDLGPRPLRSVR